MLFKINPSCSQTFNYSLFDHARTWAPVGFFPGVGKLKGLGDEDSKRDSGAEPQ